jgi:class 3 adenylate cyclase
MALNGHRQRLLSERLQIVNGPPQSHENQAWEASATARFQYTSTDNTQTRTERVNHLVSELLSAAHDIVARHRLTDAEYDVLRARLTQVGDAERGGGIGPFTMAEILRAGTVVMDHECSPDRVLATVLFTDVVDSTRHAAELGDRNWLELLERHDDLTRTQIVRFGGRVVRHTGDGAVAIFNGPSRAVQSAAALSECIAELGIGIRCGLHTGECELRGNDIGGIAVHTGARIAALAHAGEVLVSNTVKDLVNGSGITFHDRGTHELKGVPGQWRLFACG